MSDTTEELSGGYFYRNEGRDVKDILSHAPNRTDIYSKILDYDYNSDFIVAVQKPIYSEYKSMLGFELRSDLKKYPTNSKKEMNESEVVADSLLKNDPKLKLIFSHKINYWIIDNKKDKVLGPFTKVQYLKKRNELHIPGHVNVE